MNGHGVFNWWGFSPAADLINYANRNQNEIWQVLMIGAGDPRHMLKMFAMKKKKTKIKIFVLEAHVELYARMILLIGVCLRKDLGLKERATLLLDLWGNLTLRPTTKDYLEGAARDYAKAITNVSQYDHLVGLISAAKLKYRERDAIDDTFRSWYTLTTSKYDPALAWDVRLRQLLKNRYDLRRADADWAWHMRLSFRVERLYHSPEEHASNKQSSHNKQGSNNSKQSSDSSQQVNDEATTRQTRNLDGYVGVCYGWGQDFMEWRLSGHAFDLSVQSKSDLPNNSLASVVVVSDGIQQHRRVGYWGDLLSGPYPSLALATTNEDLTKLQNGRSKYSGTDVAQLNTEYLLESLWESHQEQKGEANDGNSKQGEPKVTKLCCETGTHNGIEDCSQEGKENGRELKENAYQDTENGRELKENAYQDTENGRELKENAYQDTENGRELKEKAYQDTENGRELKENAYQDTENGRELKENAYQDTENGRELKENAYQDTENGRELKENAYQDTENGRELKENAYQDTENGRELKENAYQDTENGRELKENAYQDTENGRELKENAYQDTENGRELKENAYQDTENGRELKENAYQDTENGRELKENAYQDTENGRELKENAYQDTENGRELKENAYQDTENGRELKENAYQDTENGDQGKLNWTQMPDDLPRGNSNKVHEQNENNEIEVTQSTNMTLLQQANMEKELQADELAIREDTLETHMTARKSTNGNLKQTVKEKQQYQREILEMESTSNLEPVIDLATSSMHINKGNPIDKRPNEFAINKIKLNANNELQPNKIFNSKCEGLHSLQHNPFQREREESRNLSKCDTQYNETVCSDTDPCTKQKASQDGQVVSTDLTDALISQESEVSEICKVLNTLQEDLARSEEIPLDNTWKLENISTEGHDKLTQSMENDPESIRRFKDNKHTEGYDECRLFEAALWNSVGGEESKPLSNCDYLYLEGIEVVLLSPTRLNNLQHLSEVSGTIDVVYLSAAMAHFLTPTLAKGHLAPHTTILVETARMMPELTDDQVLEYETRVTASAGEAGWVSSTPAPIGHLRFNRKTDSC